MASPPRGVEGISRSSANEAQRVRASDSFSDLFCPAEPTSLLLCGANSLRSFTPLSIFFFSRFAGSKKTFEQLTSPAWRAHVDRGKLLSPAPFPDEFRIGNRSHNGKRAGEENRLM